MQTECACQAARLTSDLPKESNRREPAEYDHRRAKAEADDRRGSRAKNPARQGAVRECVGESRSQQLKSVVPHMKRYTRRNLRRFYRDVAQNETQKCGGNRLLQSSCVGQPKENR